MKTLSFHNYRIGRAAHAPLLVLSGPGDTPVEFGPGLHLLVAPNGYGKTTLLHTLAGVLPALAGEARLEAQRISPERDVLYVSEYLTFPKFIYPGEWIDFMSGAAPDPSLQKWITALRLDARMDQVLGRMSQGERRKVTWLGAHASRRPILLLDEPLDGLDLLAIRAARDLIGEWRRQGRIVLMVAHQVGEVLDLADSIRLFKDARLQTAQVAVAEFRQKVLEFYA